MSKRQIIPYSLLLIAFLFWLYLKPQEQRSTKTDHLPNYVAYNIENVHYDDAGTITYKLYSTKATSYSTKEITLFENPKVILYVTNKQDNSITTWQLSSKSGVLSGDNNLVLTDNVWVKNLSLDQLIQTMNTERLNILLAEKEISTDLMVYWQGPEMQQQGIGMWASMLSEELIVKKQIKAIYLNETK